MNQSHTLAMERREAPEEDTVGGQGRAELERDVRLLVGLSATVRQMPILVWSTGVRAHATSISPRPRAGRTSGRAGPGGIYGAIRPTLLRPWFARAQPWWLRLGGRPAAP
jgi:hypothetical protein